MLHYQPRISLASGTIVSVEALVRWNHPTQGLVLPDDFLPMAEEMGVMDALGVWVVRHACRQLALWHQEQLVVSLSINISAHQLQSPPLYEALLKALSGSSFPPEALELELTESAFMQDLDTARAMLMKIADLGLRLSVDDFGTGYSSLSLLKALPLDSLKMDQSFMEGLTEDSSNATIVAATIGMAQKIGLKVVAEGVTTMEQLQFLRQLQCDQAQGYLFGQPCAAAEFGTYLRAYCTAPVIQSASQAIGGLADKKIHLSNQFDDERSDPRPKPSAEK